MVNKIYELKNEILGHVDNVVHERGIERMDVDRVNKLIDMVHHLAESESNCWQAEYYRTVTEAMKGDTYGYSGYGSMQNSGGRQGYAPGTGGTGSSAGYATQSMHQGYMGFDEAMDPLRNMIREAKPDERERMRNEVLKMVGAL